jgi:hypothetical protein
VGVEIHAEIMTSIHSATSESAAVTTRLENRSQDTSISRTNCTTADYRQW